MREHADGTRIRLIEMTDPYPAPVGTEGTITGYEPSIGYLNEAYHVNWDNGSRLKVLVDVDHWEVIE
jgi:hypothetical protein